MRIVFAVLIGVSMLLGLGFVIPFGPPWRSENPPMAWLQAGLAWVALAFDSALFLSLFHVAMPVVVVVLILLAQDTVFGWRLAVLIRERRSAEGWNMKSTKAKAIVALVATGATAGLIAAQTAVPMSPAAHGWVAVALAVLGTVSTTGAVYRVPNAPAEPKP